MTTRLVRRSFSGGGCLGVSLGALLSSPAQARSLPRDADDHRALRSRDRPRVERALRDVPCGRWSGVPAVDLRRDLAEGAAHPRRGDRAPHAAVGSGARLRRLRERQWPHAARDAVRRLVGGRSGAEERRAGVPQRPGSDRPRPREIRAERHDGHWQVGTPELTREIAAELPSSGSVARVVVDPGIASIRHLRALEYQPGNRRATVRAVFFTVERRTMAWQLDTLGMGSVRCRRRLAIGFLPGRASWPRSTIAPGAPAIQQWTARRLFFSGFSSALMDSDVTIIATPGSRIQCAGKPLCRLNLRGTVARTAGGSRTSRVSARSRAGATEVLLFAQDPPAEWPTPYVFKKPVLLRAGTSLVVTGSFADGT